MKKKKCPQSGVIASLKINKISGKVLKFVENTIQNWRVKRTGENEKLK